ncbi:hypothetical protein NH340_JMT03589 [Sarcoptes scabiei]|nr:hypothetical protein NH340_JMT03589 [Sarcoptes scabiei]
MINKLIKNLYESILFLPKSYRHKLYIGSSVLALTASTSIYVSLQTFKIDRFVEHLQMYRMRMPIPVHQDLNELLHQVVMDFGPNKLNSPLCIFNFIGNDMYSIGNISLPTGAFIGVPYNMNLNSINQLKVEDIRFLGRFKTKRTAESPIIQQLFRSLLYSTQAKRFALAHEFNLLSSSYFFVKTFNIAFNTLIILWFFPKLNKISNNSLPKLIGYKKTLLSLSFLMLVISTGILIDHTLDHFYDIWSLKKTIRFNREYLNGAIEYYSKLIDRNKSIFELLGDKRSQFFTSDGRTKKLFGIYSLSYEKHLKICHQNLFIDD